MTSYNGPREIRVSSDDPKLKQDLDRLVADSVRAQPPVRRSVVRWQKSVPVSLDSTVICFVPSAGDTMVLPRPLPIDDGRTIVIAVATGSGVLTVEAPRGASVTKVGESADIRTLEQPGAYTFTVIDGVYYVATAISGSIPPTIITEAMEIEGPALVGRSSADVGTTTEITLGNMLNFVGNTLEIIFSTGPALLGSGSGGSAGQVLVGEGLEMSIEGVLFVTGLTTDQLELGTAGVLGYTSTSSSTATVMHPSASGQVVMYDGSSVGWGSVDVADGSITRAKLANFGRYLCALSNTTDQSFTAASGVQTVNWFNEISDDDSLHSTVSNEGRISIPVAGLWEIAWEFRATQTGTLNFWRDGTTALSNGYSIALATENIGMIKRNLPVGYIEMVFDINTNGTSDGPSCKLTVTSLGP